MKTLYLLAHLGLGDHIIFNGLVRYLAARWPAVIVPCKRHNLPSVKWMFSDLENTLVLPVSGDDEARSLADYGWNLKLGLHRTTEDLDFSAWDQQIYRQAEVPFAERWHGFNLPGGVRTPDAKEKKEVAFVHDDKERGFVIDRFMISLPIVEPRKIEKGTIFDWLADLQTASEIHVIDSAFLCLADSVPTLAKLLVFHKYARPQGHPPTLRKNWEILT